MSFGTSPGPELTAALSEKLSQIRVLQAQALDIVAEMDRRNIANEAGYSGLAAFLMDTVRVSRKVANRMIKQADQITQTVTPTGHVTPAPLPSMRVAMHDGVVDLEHLDVVLDVVKHLPDGSSREDRELVESTLAADARETHPNAVRKLGEQIIARIDQDGDAPKEREQTEPKNSLRYRRTSAGRFIATLDIDQEAGEELEDMLTVLGAPRQVAPGIPDSRPHAQRMGEAFAEIVHAAAKSGDLPSKKPHLAVYLDYNALMEGIGTATLEGGSFLCPSAARRLACDAEVIPMVLNGDSVPLDVGRAHRFITDHQRRALIARDKGCSFPHCDRKPRWCDGHHIKHWLHGGATDLRNLTLLCRHHHRLIHHSEWEVRMTSSGMPEFIPPAWLDRNRKPLRNVLHE
jgi:hypothetical protein